MTSAQDDAGHPGSLLSQLRYWLGDDFLDWVLAGGTPPLTSNQQEVVALLRLMCSGS